MKASPQRAPCCANKQAFSVANTKFSPKSPLGKHTLRRYWVLVWVSKTLAPVSTDEKVAKSFIRCKDTPLHHCRHFGIFQPFAWKAPVTILRRCECYYCRMLQNTSVQCYNLHPTPWLEMAWIGWKQMVRSALNAENCVTAKIWNVTCQMWLGTAAILRSANPFWGVRSLHLKAAPFVPAGAFVILVSPPAP